MRILKVMRFIRRLIQIKEGWEIMSRLFLVEQVNLAKKYYFCLMNYFQTAQNVKEKI